MLSLQRESFAALGTSSSMELLPVTLSVLLSAPTFLHFPSSASFFIHSLWSDETCDGLWWLLESVPLKKREKDSQSLFGFLVPQPNAKQWNKCYGGLTWGWVFCRTESQSEWGCSENMGVPLVWSFFLRPHYGCCKSAHTFRTDTNWWYNL